MKNPLQKSRIPEQNAFVVKELIAPHFDKNWHFHPEYQLFLVVKGKGTRFVGDQMEPFREYDMVLTGPNLPHLWRNDPAYFNKNTGLFTHGIVIYFPENFLGNAIHEKEEFEDINLLLHKSSRGLAFGENTVQNIHVMLEHLLHSSKSFRVIRLLEILQYLSTASDSKPIASVGYTNTNKESEKDRMNKVYEFVMENYHNKIQLSDVSELANMTESAFSRYFKSRMNKTFTGFLTEVRIGQACKLLHEVDKNISEISYECGFNTLSNFNRLFKEKVGQSPLLYKQDYLKSLSTL